jgi:aryl-alcohol dehydrogenase-like predicted oxidoreductase
MEYRRLGATELKVSAVCLGAMTFGKQNSEAEAHAQLDLAFALARPFVASVIIGATDLQQLASNLAALETNLGGRSAEAHRRNSCPELQPVPVTN